MMEGSKRFVLLFLVLLSVFTTGSVAKSETKTRISSFTAQLEAEQDEFTDEPYFRSSNLRKLKSSSSDSERVNIWQKFKDSLGLFVVGLILIVCSPFFIWKNEGRHVNTLAKIDYCKNKAVLVDCSSPSEDDNGQLVHFVGEVKNETDLEFESGGLNITSPISNAIIIKRTCYIYQKFEDAEVKTDKDIVGGGETRTTEYTLREDWATSPQSNCEHLEESNSRGIWDEIMSVANSDAQNTLITSNAHVGDFGISQDVITQNMFVFQSELEPLPSNYLPDEVEGCEGLIKSSNNILQTFPEGDPPENGACKVVYEYAVDGFECSFVVQQISYESEFTKFGVERCDVVEDKCFGACHNDLGEIWMVRRGLHDLEEMVNMAKQDEDMMVKILRVVCYVALLAGWVMLFSPFTTVLSILPILSQLGYFAVVLTSLIVSCVCCCTITAAAYVRFRPVLAIGILALAGIIWGIVIWRLDVAAKTGGGSTAQKSSQFISDMIMSSVTVKEE